MTTKFSQLKHSSKLDYYTGFDQLDGSHPWRELSNDGFVLYPVRELRGGKVAYFNYILAKEMGLIAASHPHLMNVDLERKLLSTFSIQIINEFDELSQKRIDQTTVKKNKYMATRYLQLQHPNKQGKTSGDGRGIWNGTVNYKGVIWDVSSRGTGVTCLAPGAVEANKPLKTGGTEFGYGCGLAEIDELLGAAILAEVMHLQGIHTERILCIIDLGKGYGIGVRSAPNLLRPAHLFRYLKQEKFVDLKKSVDYFLNRQVANGRWDIKLRSVNKYDQMLNQITREFAEFSAKLDMEYIFAWLDWDGDNVLAEAGIIDYGSVRQFGSRHDKYRYDDVERFSTNLNEQRLKARYLVQVFAQMVDYLKTGKKKNIKEFANHEMLKTFNNLFKEHRSHRLLYRIGFNREQRDLILKNNDLYQKFDREFSYFERAKISGSAQKVADGVNHPPLFNMRIILRMLPQNLRKDFKSSMPYSDFFTAMLSKFARIKDSRIRLKHKKHIDQFQTLYKELIQLVSQNVKVEKTLDQIIERSNKINSDMRITGNALIEIVDEIIAEKKRNLPLEHLQKIIDRLIYEARGNPETQVSKYFSEGTPAVKEELYRKLLTLVATHKDDI